MHTHFSERARHARTFEAIKTPAFQRKLTNTIHVLIALLAAISDEADQKSGEGHGPGLAASEKG